MKSLLTIFCLISLSAFAREGHDTGGGGIGVPRGEQILLYDFVEAGIEDNVSIDESVGDAMGALKVIKASILATPEVQKLISDKLNEINELSPTLGQTFIKTIQDYQWRFILPNLRSTNDIGRTPIRISLEQKQIANRDDSQKTVTIDRQYLALMPAAHQAGLFLHEIVYALAATSDSYTSRIFNSYLFHPSFSFQSFDQLKTRVRLAYPNMIILDHREADLVLTPDFKRKCEAFKKTVTSPIKSALAFQSKVTNELVAYESKNCYLEYRTVSKTSFRTQYLGEDFLMVNQSYSFPSRLPCQNGNMYSFSLENQKILVAQKALAQKLLSQNEKDFVGICLSEQDMLHVRKLSTMNTRIVE